jgi:cytochrome c5
MVLGLVLGLGLGASALADGPPPKRMVSSAKKSAPAKKPAAVVSKVSAPAAETPKAIVERACVACHDMGTITQSRHAASEWPGVVQRMRGNGADLTDAEIKQVQAYLAKTYSSKR